MFNVTIINIKDIMKYLVSITLVIILLFILTRYFSGVKDNNDFKLLLNDKLSLILNNNYTICLDATIPCIKNVNKEINKIASDIGEKIDISI